MNPLRITPNRPPIFAFVALCVAACATTPQPPPPPRPVATAPRHVTPPDWFHRELALARHARKSHLPPSDTKGAQHAYYSVMLPACERVAKSGPDKYRARCRALTEHATTAATLANDDFDCKDEQDDSRDSQAEKTACSD